MKAHHIIFLLILILAGCATPDAEPNAALHELYAELDMEIARSRDYEEVKENRIADLRRQLARTRDAARKTEIINGLITEFDAYNSDSALHYISLNLRRPEIRTRCGMHQQANCPPAWMRRKRHIYRMCSRCSTSMSWRQTRQASVP